MRKTTIGFAVIGALLSSSAALATEINYKDLALTGIKLDPGFDYAENAAAFMSAFERRKYDKYKNDEFEFDDQKAKEIEIMKSVIAKVDPDKEYTLTTDTSFGSYDFANSNYPFTLGGGFNPDNFPKEAIPDSTYFKITPAWDDETKTPDSKTKGTIPSVFALSFTNAAEFGTIKLDKDAAKALLKSRTDSAGGVDRVLKTVFTVKIKSVGNALEGNRPSAKVEIQKITFYKDNGGKNVLYVAQPEKATETPKS